MEVTGWGWGAAATGGSETEPRDLSRAVRGRGAFCSEPTLLLLLLLLLREQNKAMGTRRAVGSLWSSGTQAGQGAGDRGGGKQASPGGM